MHRYGLSLIKRTGGIDTSDATAGPYQILVGYSGYVDDDRIEGTMPNRGAHMYSLPVNTSYNIPDGWHNGNGKITQSLETQGTVTITPGTSPKLVCAADRWTTGDLWVAGDADLVASNIKVDVNLFGLKGTYKGCVTTDATVTAAQILTGYSAYGSAGTKIAGTMPNNGSVNQSIGVDGSYTIPAGWHSGSGKVTQSLTTQAGWTATPSTGNILLCSKSRWTTGDIWAKGDANFKAENFKKGVNIFGITGTFDKPEVSAKSVISTFTSKRRRNSWSGRDMWWGFLWTNAPYKMKGWNWLYVCAHATVYVTGQSQSSVGRPTNISQLQGSYGDCLTGVYIGEKDNMSSFDIESQSAPTGAKFLSGSRTLLAGGWHGLTDTAYDSDDALYWISKWILPIEYKCDISAYKNSDTTYNYISVSSYSGTNWTCWACSAGDHIWMANGSFWFAL